ncbi:MAG: hypothetical protein BMS9Abin11_1576 [Gammaproteobacteria bacterium]|nr:MAG: hypothetical protein BMS9Abin11_1576 [Gammaproteobacteria bacterium]
MKSTRKVRISRKPAKSALPLTEEVVALLVKDNTKQIIDRIKVLERNAQATKVILMDIRASAMVCLHGIVEDEEELISFVANLSLALDNIHNLNDVKVYKEARRVPTLVVQEDHAGLAGTEDNDTLLSGAYSGDINIETIEP